jgi:hypothetical protein
VAKVTVSFVTEDDSSRLSIESDPDRNTDYTGRLKSKFRYGDTAYFRIYSQEPEKLEVYASDGTLSDLGIFAGEVTGETLQFTSGQTVNTDKPVKGINTFKWLGKSLGEVVIQDPYTLRSVLPPSPADGLIALANVSYKTAYRLYGLTLGKQTEEEYPVLVYVRVSDV